MCMALEAWQKKQLITVRSAGGCIRLRFNEGALGMQFLNFGALSLGPRGAGLFLEVASEYRFSSNHHVEFVSSPMRLAISHVTCLCRPFSGCRRHEGSSLAS